MSVRRRVVADARGDDVEAEENDRHDPRYLPPRLATLDDVDRLVTHRELMFVEMGTPRDARLAEMLVNARTWFRKHLADGSYLGFVLETKDRSMIAGAGLAILEWPPTYTDLKTARAYIFNVYVDVAHRRRGIARRLAAACIDAGRERDIRVVTLHASGDGRALYERMGFVATNEMRFVVDG